MESLKGIADSLRDHDLNVSALDVDAMSPSDVLGLIRTLISRLDERFTIDAVNGTRPSTPGRRPETATTAAIRRETGTFFSSDEAIIEFFSLMECPTIPTCAMLTTKSVLIVLLGWLAENFSALSKRVGLLRFCRRIQVPDDIFFGSDRSVADQFNRLETLQAEMKLLYSDLSVTEIGTAELHRTQAAVSKLHLDKRVVSDKVKKLRAQLDCDPSFSQVLASVQQLRENQERVDSLSAHQDRLDAELQSLREALEVASDEIDDLDSALTAGGLEGLKLQLGKKQSEADSFATSIEELEAEKPSLELVVGQPVRATDVALLENRTTALQAKLERRQLEIQQKGDNEKLSLYYQQYRAVRDRVSAARRELDTLLATKRKCQTRRDREEREFESANGAKYVSETKFSEFVKLVRQRGNEYKMARAELAELEAEIRVLTRTADELKAQAVAVLQEGSDEGVSLSEVTEHVNTANQQKESQLEKISAIVSDLSKKLNAKKIIIAPKLKELKSRRGTREALQEKAAIIERNMEQELAPILDLVKAKEKELDKLTNVISQLEEHEREVSGKISASIALLVRAEDEVKFRDGSQRYRDQYRAYEDFLTAKLAEKESELTVVKERFSTMLRDESVLAKKRSDFSVVFKLLESRIEAQKAHKRPTHMQTMKRLVISN